MGLIERFKQAREVAKDGGRLNRRNTAQLRIDMLLVGSVCLWLQEVATRVPDDLVDPLMNRMALKGMVGLGPDDADQVHRSILNHATIDAWRQDTWPAAVDPIVYRYGEFKSWATAVLSRPEGQSKYQQFLLPDADAAQVIEHGQTVEWFPSSLEEKVHTQAAKRARSLLYDGGLLERCPKASYAWRLFLRDNPDHQAAELARQYESAPHPG